MIVTGEPAATVRGLTEINANDGGVVSPSRGAGLGVALTGWVGADVGAPAVVGAGVSVEVCWGVGVADKAGTDVDVTDVPAAA